MRQQKESWLRGVNGWNLSTQTIPISHDSCGAFGEKRNTNMRCVMFLFPLLPHCFETKGQVKERPRLANNHKTMLVAHGIHRPAALPLSPRSLTLISLL